MAIALSVLSATSLSLRRVTADSTQFIAFDKRRCWQFCKCVWPTARDTFNTQYITQRLRWYMTFNVTLEFGKKTSRFEIRLKNSCEALHSFDQSCCDLNLKGGSTDLNPMSLLQIHINSVRVLIQGPWTKSSLKAKPIFGEAPEPSHPFLINFHLVDRLNLNACHLENSVSGSDTYH